jgi:hypothetical protein
MKSHDVQTVCNELVALANRRGGHDNITVQVVRVLHAGPRSSHTLAQEPADVPSRRITTTIDGTPHPPGPTLVQEPALEAGPIASAPHSGYADLARTAPDMPLPTYIDPPEGSYLTPPPPEPASFHASGTEGPETDDQPSALIYVVLSMAAVIGLLLALLLWALYFR